MKPFQIYHFSLGRIRNRFISIFLIPRNMDIVQYFHALQSVRMLRMYSHKLRFLRFAENLNTFYPPEHSLHIACWVDFTLGSQDWSVR